MNCQLPIGIEFAGKIHRDFELRPELVADFIEVYEDPKYGKRALKNEHFAGVCVLARRLEKLGDIPKADITPELLLKMRSKDFMAMRVSDDRGLLRPGPDSEQHPETGAGTDGDKV